VRWPLALPLAYAALVPLSVSAAVLTLENEAQLCTAVDQGRRAVDRDALAYAIVTEAGAGLYLDGANPTGIRDRAIQLKTSGGILSEPVYAVLNAATRTVAEDNRPFGPNVDLRTDRRALEAQKAIVKALREELFFLMTRGSMAAGPQLTYRVEPRRIVGGARSDPANPELLFREDAPVVILCVAGDPPPATAPPTRAQSTESPSTSIGAFIADAIRLRGAVKDLAVKADDLRSATPASISYERDEEADAYVLGLNAVVGFRFGDSTGAFDAIPYLSYERRDANGSQGDLEKLSPGVLVGYRIERAAFAVHSRVEGSLIEDLQQDASQGKLRVYVDPAIALGSGRGVLFGSYLKPVGPLRMRPDLTLIGDATAVFDDGTSAELAGASSYFGLGAQASLRLRLAVGQPLSDFVAEGGVRYLWLVGDIKKDSTTRWFGRLDYAPENFPYLGIGIVFTKGQNDDTLQDEETYGLEFTVRY
jgi:hypothetical protein